MKRLTPILAGVALAVVTAGVALRLSPNAALELLAVILAAAGAVYVGAALASGEARLVRLETAVFAFVFALALVGLWASATVLALGYLVHGLWDLVHHPRRAGAPAGAWYPPFCLVYDVLVGAFIFVRYA